MPPANLSGGAWKGVDVLPLGILDPITCMPVICADPLLDEDSLTCTSLDLNAVTYNAIQYIQIDNNFSPTGDRSLP